MYLQNGLKNICLRNIFNNNMVNNYKVYFRADYTQINR